MVGARARAHPNLDAPALQDALARAKDGIARYVKAQGLADIDNPKRSRDGGVSLHIGASEIEPGRSAKETLDRADDGVNLGKLKEQDTMSTEARLARLGLTHLANDPEALLAETKRRIAEYDAKVDRLRAARLKAAQDRLAAQGAPPETKAK